MPRPEDINLLTDYEKKLYSMTDEEFTQYATSEEMNLLYADFSEADKTAFLIRSMMLGENRETFYNDLIYRRTNMYDYAPQKVSELTDANKEVKTESLLEFQYEVYRAILYSNQDNIMSLASKTTKTLTASEIFNQHVKLKEIFFNHLQIPVGELSVEDEEEMMNAAKKEQADFMASLDALNNDAEKEKEQNKEPEEHVYVPLKDREQDIDINKVDDYVERNEFTVSDKNGDYNIVIKPLGDRKPESLLDGYDLKETSTADKRNMLFSYVLQGSGRFEITDKINTIQAKQPLKEVLDYCLLVMSSQEIIENKELIKKAIYSGDPVSPDAYNLNYKVNALGRRKKIENPNIKKYDDYLFEENEYDNNNNININQDDSYNQFEDIMFVPANKNKDFIVKDKDLNIEIDFNRPERKFGDLEDKVKNANVWIDELKAEYEGDAYTADKLAARILAARILVDSERGVLKSLKKPLNGRDIDALAEKLLENGTFHDFLNNLKVEEKRSLLTHSGHGGVLEDKFKDYILKLEAGKLHNDSILDRFMPKVYQRIEELQRQAAKKNPTDGIYREAGEVMLLRAMIGARRNQPDKLAAKIPTGSDLAKEVEELSSGEKNPNFVMACSSEKVFNDFQKGHGGLMMENLYKAPANSLEKEAVTKNFRKYCTAKYRYEKLQERAKAVLDDLHNSVREDEGSLKTRDCCMEARDVLAEAIVMAMAMSREDHTNKEISPTIKTIQTGTGIIKKDDTFNTELFPNRNPEEYYRELKGFAEAKDPKAYAESHLGRLREAYADAHPEEVNKANNNSKKMGNSVPEKGKENVIKF